LWLASIADSGRWVFDKYGVIIESPAGIRPAGRQVSQENTVERIAFQGSVDAAALRMQGVRGQTGSRDTS
jgi:hypothetical protein